MIAIMLRATTGLFRDAPRRPLRAGDVLFRRGDPVRALHLVLEGEVALTRALADGGALALHRAGPGALVAEASLFAEVHGCDTAASRDGALAVVPVAAARARLAADGPAALALLAGLSEEVRRLRARVEILRLRRVADRLDAHLALHDPPAPGGWAVVAEAIGVTPPALYRELARRRPTPSPAPLAPRLVEQLDQLEELGALVVGVARGHRVLDAVARVVLDHQALHGAQRGADGRGLRKHVDAVAVLLDHARHAAHLALEPREPPGDRRLVALVGHRRAPPACGPAPKPIPDP